MSSRFLTNLGLLLAAGFLLVACFAFSPTVVGWLALGTGCATVLVSLVGFGLRRRGASQRALDLLLAGLGGWLIVASRAYDPGTVKWLAVGAGAASAVLAVAGLLAHEVARAAPAPAVEAGAQRREAESTNGHCQALGSHPAIPAASPLHS